MTPFITETAPFTEYPMSWIIWAINVSAVVFVVYAGGYLTIIKKIRCWLPLAFAFFLTYGWRWLVQMPIPEVVKSETVVDSAGEMIPMISHSASVDLIAWGAAATILLSLLKKTEPNQALQTMTIADTSAAAHPPRQL